MKKVNICRLLALVLALFLLAGCGTPSSTEDTQKQEKTEFELPEQEELSRKKRKEALYQLEYSALAAALEAEDRVLSLTGYLGSDPIFVGDTDADGEPELAHSGVGLFFDIAEDRKLTYQFSQSGLTFHTDREGTFYIEASIGDTHEEQQGDQLLSYDYFRQWYDVWKDGAWETVLTSEEESIQECFYDADSGYFAYGDVLEESCAFTKFDHVVTREEYTAYIERIGMREVTSLPGDFTVTRFGAEYTESLLEAISEYLVDAYDGSILRQDIDGDGWEETIFALPNLITPWLQSLRENLTGEPNTAEQILEGTLSPARDYTAILIADLVGDEVVVSAHCALNYVGLYDGMDLEYRDQGLWLDDTLIYIPDTFATLEDLSQEQYAGVLKGLAGFLESGGYSQVILRSADISDAPGREMLCLCYRGGNWHLLVVVFREGSPHVIWNSCLDNSAVYLTQVDGKEAILWYNQDMYLTMDGQICTQYSYDVLRFGGNLEFDYLDNHGITYFDNDVDASLVSAFFDQFNSYLVKALVIADPYQLLGNAWLASDQADYGQPPQEPEQEQAGEYQLGFVDIKDPGSWLNLREGPGTNYDRVLTDPKDPDSFVRQARGAPVTVLEIVKTDDKNYPEWVHIRITYGNQTIEGYSAKAFIRLQEET